MPRKCSLFFLFLAHPFSGFFSRVERAFVNISRKISSLRYDCFPAGCRAPSLVREFPARPFFSQYSPGGLSPRLFDPGVTFSLRGTWSSLTCNFSLFASLEAFSARVNPPSEAV